MIVMRISAVVALLVVLLAGCSDAGAGSGDGAVVASFYPLEYVAERVAGEHQEVVALTSPGIEPHDLELSPRQTIDVAEARVLVYSRGLQPAVDDAVAQSDTEHVVDAAEVADLLQDDPHFWLDPTRLDRVAEAVAEQLSHADPANADDYAANLADLQRDLDALDRDLRDGLDDCVRDTVVVSHDAFGYVEDRYGLRFEAINGLSPDAEPSPAHLRELAELIESEGITTVFSETLATPELADTLAGDLGLRTDVLDPIEGLSDDTADQDYVSLMRGNLAALQEANDCR
jgi:zinc transport system substrate-binding protein